MPGDERNRVSPSKEERNNVKIGQCAKDGACRHCRAAMLRRSDQGSSRASQGNLRQRIHSAALPKSVLDSARVRCMTAANLEQRTIRFHIDSAAIRSRNSSFGPAARLHIVADMGHLRCRRDYASNRRV
jgi:hypothetical protein